jgi:hypothetical protein
MVKFKRYEKKRNYLRGLTHAKKMAEDILGNLIYYSI